MYRAWTRPILAAVARSGRVLLKVRHAGGETPLSFMSAAGTIHLEHLFDAGAPLRGPGLAPGVRESWYAAAVEAGGRDENPWELTHHTVETARNNLGGGDVLAAEPDLLQQWISEPPLGGEHPLAARAECLVEAQNADLPMGPGDHWHLGPDFSQLALARAAVAGAGSDVLIAHLDTGYDPDHLTRPERLLLVQRSNFVEADRPDDPRDVTGPGLLHHRGHGTGTLGILAGAKLGDDYLGGAPKAQVVPLRVADSVVHFRTSGVAAAIDRARELGADVLSMSMGGVPSRAWADAVNKAYEAGVVMVTAAGNNFAGFPARYIVYPARFRRVIAACGVMADFSPYHGLPPWVVQGNYGPSSKMRTALSAFTPNVSWARLGCKTVVSMDGQGTSAAAPQIAAAAALWLRKYKQDLAGLPPWRRVEAVRHALFSSARRTAGNLDPSELEEVFGRGLLQAHTALQVDASAASQLPQTPRDSATFGLFKALLGLGLSGDDPRAALFRLELTQLATSLRELPQLVPDPDAPPEQINEDERRRLFEAILESGKASRPLAEHLEEKLGRRARLAGRPGAGVSNRRAPEPRPSFRRLRIFAVDPSLGRSLDTWALNETTVNIPWESSAASSNLLSPGPVGEYLEVVDVDPSSGCVYAPVDLNHPYLLAQDGLSPSEGDPQFHQQMVYAVAMMTIRNFENALGRSALWAPRDHDPDQPHRDGWVQRLRIYPHALREANAYYSPRKKALLFGYFPDRTRSQSSSSMVFTCLSHDVVAHETSHALLDGLHRRMQERSNPDVAAFHEAFSDLVAIFQHFTFPQLLRHEIQRSAGNLELAELLAGLAREFGQALGRSTALRSAIGADPRSFNYTSTTEAHDRGSILVAAVFSAFLAIYRRRTADLMRLARAASASLHADALHPDLLERLAGEASKSAGHVLTICIRALDYLPPVDVRFPEYLRALITADADLVPDDPHGYRVAFLEAFRAWGIHPEDVRTASVESLHWRAPMVQPPGLAEAVRGLDLSWELGSDRRQVFEGTRVNATRLHGWVQALITGGFGRHFGLSPSYPVEVHSVRPARRASPDNTVSTDLIAVITQKRPAPHSDGQGEFIVRGGCTLIIDAAPGRERVRYAIVKNVDSKSREEQQRRFLEEEDAASLSALYFNQTRHLEPFALMHRAP